MKLPGGKEISNKIVIGVAGGIVVLAGIAVAVILSMKGSDTYRSITVLETVGKVIVTRNSEQMEPYKDMKLENGDDIQVESASELDMILDTDKTVYVEENTHMWLEVAGAADSSTTVIHMDGGATLHKIDNKLSDDSTYQVDTPNSTMSIRGTLPRVVVEEKDGIFYTDYQVFEGDVEIQLKTTEGEPVGDPVSLSAGYEIKTMGNEVTAAAAPIDYSQIPVAALEQLEEIAISGDKTLSMGDQELKIEELQEIVNDAKVAEAAEDKTAQAADESMIKEVEKVSIVTPEVVPTEPEPIATPAITPRAKVLAEPTPVVRDAGAITPAVTPAPTAVAAIAEESASSEGSSSNSAPVVEYTVTFLNRNGALFCTQTVRSGEKWITPLLRPDNDGTWPAPQVVTGDVTVQFGQ